MEQQSDFIVAVPDAELPSYVVSDQETNLAASLLNKVVALAESNGADVEEKPSGSSMKRA
jgi:hypothetical protein